MLVLVNVSENVNLMDCALLEFLIILELFHLDHLNSVFLGVKLINSPINFPVGALPDNFIKRVVLNDSDHGLKEQVSLFL